MIEHEVCKFAHGQHDGDAVQSFRSLREAQECDYEENWKTFSQTQWELDRIEKNNSLIFIVECNAMTLKSRQRVELRH